MSELSKLTIYQLAQRAAKWGIDADLLEELCRRDAQRTVWPVGSAAAAQLARAHWIVFTEEIGVGTRWDDLPLHYQYGRIDRFAAVLARLNAAPRSYGAPFPEGTQSPAPPLGAADIPGGTANAPDLSVPRPEGSRASGAGMSRGRGNDAA